MTRLHRATLQTMAVRRKRHLKRGPHHVWVREERVFLDALFVVSEGDWIFITTLFNEKFNRGLTRSKLVAQYNERKTTASTWLGVSHDRNWYEQNRPELIVEIEAMVSRGPLSTTHQASLSMDENRDRVLDGAQHSYPRDNDLTLNFSDSLRVNVHATKADHRNIGAEIVTEQISPTTRRERAAAARLASSLAREKRQQDLTIARASPRLPFKPIDEAQAHPEMPTLFYRFYSTSSHHTLNLPLSKGFVAGIFKSIYGPLPPPPPSSDPRLFVDVEHHINRNHVHSPFVSVSNSFSWSLRQAVKKLNEAQDQSLPYGDIHISVIDARQAGGSGGQKCYYVPAFHQQLKERKVFTDGAWTYGGACEFLVWGEIPPEAVLCDFAVAEFASLCRELPDLDSLFRLQILSQKGPSAKASRQLKLGAHELNHQSVLAIACFLRWMPEFTSRSTTSVTSDQVAKLVSDIMHGWYIRPSHSLSFTQWADLAKTFAASILPARTSAAERSEIQRAFLAGAISSYGDLNWQFNAHSTQLMFRRAQDAGLQSPDVILANGTSPIIAGIQAYAYTAAATTPAVHTPRRPIRSVAARQISSLQTPPSTPQQQMARQVARYGAISLSSSSTSSSASSCTADVLLRTPTRLPPRRFDCVMIPMVDTSDYM